MDFIFFCVIICKDMDFIPLTEAMFDVTLPQLAKHY